ncbi:ABC transporter permease [Crossiella sp. NPDC003009]
MGGVVIRRWTAFSVCALVVAVALLGPFLAAGSPTTPVGAPFQPPDHHCLLGTDKLGRDVLTRLLHGGYLVLGLSALATVVSTALGGLAGMLAGLYPNRWGRAAMRVLDALTVAPPLLVLLVLSAGFPGCDLVIVLAVVLTTAPMSARVVRAATSAVAAQGYVEVARARGDSVFSLLRHDILPNIRGQLLADAGVRFVAAIYLSSTAGFLGLGHGAPAPNWGQMVAENLAGLSLTAWPVLAPAMLLAAFVIGVNLLADQWGRVAT